LHRFSKRADKLPPLKAMAYPPPDHYLSDLGARPIFDADSSRVSVEVTPALCAPGDGVLLGVLATVIDMAAGGLSRRAADPDWVATSDIAIDLAASIPPGPCRVDCRLARRGRALVTLEIDLLAGRYGEERRHGLATAAFAVLPNPGRDQGGGARGDGRDVVAGEAESSGAASQRAPTAHPPSARAPLPLHERLGLRIVDRAHGVVEASLDEYVRNTFGALQGGVVAVLAEAAMIAATSRPLAALAVRYRSLGRTGPFRTEVDRLPGALGEVLRATLYDRGAADAVVAVATGRLAAG
jgi:acyl-coenzyme A thioesterase PaaI-like protein